MPLPILNSNHWDSSYENLKDFLAFTTQDINNILKSVESTAPKTLLDIGCGTGQLGREFFHRGYTTLGIDSSSTAIKVAKDATIFNENKVQYLQSSFEDFREKEFTFGLITCKYVFAFIEDRPQFLNKVRRLLSTDGVFIIISPDVDKVAAEKARIAVNNTAMLNLLEDVFKVESYQRGRDFYYVCKKIEVSD
jgi:2-polyprenyl-3-methyl-5-hydroxy-6-metoxy-1,4-benzoquinol methylase